MVSRFKPGWRLDTERADRRRCRRDATRGAIVEAARAAAAIIRRYYKTDLEVELKGHDDPLTAADSRVERPASRSCVTLGAFPDDGWLSEETADSAGAPRRSRASGSSIRSTARKEFTQHMPEFCVCIALVEDGRPIVGVEYQPGRRPALLRRALARARR